MFHKIIVQLRNPNPFLLMINEGEINSIHEIVNTNEVLSLFAEKRIAIENGEYPLFENYSYLMPNKGGKVWLTKKSSEWLSMAQYRLENRDWLNKACEIALYLLEYMDVNKINKHQLSEKLDMKYEDVNLIVKGQYNLTLQAICQIEKSLNIEMVRVNNFPTPPFQLERKQ